MKQFLKSFIYFFVPLIVLAISVESILRYSPNDYNFKSKYMTDHANEIECLVLGNSHSAWGIDPNEFSFNTFNLAFAGQPLIFDNLLLQKYITKMNDLKCVVLSVSYVVPYCDFEHEKNDRSTKIYPIYFNIHPDYANWKFYFEITANSPRTICSRLIGLFSNTELRCANKGQYYAHCMDVSKDFGNGASNRHNENYRVAKDSLPIIYCKNIEALKNIVSICQKKGIACFLVLPPHSQTYISNLSMDMKMSTMQLLKKLNRNNSNVFFIDFSNDIRFMSNDLFSDEDHLCRNGAMQYSKILNDTIMSLGKCKKK